AIRERRGDGQAPAAALAAAGPYRFWSILFFFLFSLALDRAKQRVFAVAVALAFVFGAAQCVALLAFKRLFGFERLFLDFALGDEFPLRGVVRARRRAVAFALIGTGALRAGRFRFLHGCFAGCHQIIPPAQSPVMAWPRRPPPIAPPTVAAVLPLPLPTWLPAYAPPPPPTSVLHAPSASTIAT